MSSRKINNCKNYESYSDNAAELLLNLLYIYIYIYQIHTVVTYLYSVMFGVGILKFILDLDLLNFSNVEIESK